MTQARRSSASRGSARRSSASSGSARRPSAVLPVARVVVDVSLPHLDRPFDYLVPEALHDSAVAGARVRVRFAGRLVDGYVIERLAESDYSGELAFVEKVIDDIPVLAPEILELAREVADRYAGTLPDVLRLAIPPRAAAATTDRPAAPPDRDSAPRASASVSPASGPLPTGSVASEIPSGWQGYVAGPALLAALAAGRAVRAVWTALPGQCGLLPRWAVELAEAVAAARRAGRGALVIVPDAGELAAVETACARVLGADSYVTLHADLGPGERYRRFVDVVRGTARVVIGTVGAVFAPVHDLGLVVVWDDGDDRLVQRRAPYPHARDVALLRAHRQQTALILGGYAVTAEAARLLAMGWAKPVVPRRTVLRAAAPKVIADAGDPAGGRLPDAAWRAARAALRAGLPVLVHVPRRGYLPALACAQCRSSARCAQCAGPLGLPSAGAAPTCRWCGRPAADWRCPSCGGQRLRSVVIGVSRTAEELGRAFPGTPIRLASGDQPLQSVPAEPALVVATPAAEPVAEGGYGAAILLDGWVVLARPALRAAEDAVRRWLAAASLVRSDGRVVIIADGGLAPVQAAVRWAPLWFAERELAERAAAGLPPSTIFVAVDAPRRTLLAFQDALHLPDGTEVFGPVDLDAGAYPPDDSAPGDEARQRLLLRADRAAHLALADALRTAQRTLSARMPITGLRVQVDPPDVV